VTEIELPPHFRELGNAHRQIQYFEVSRALRDEYERHAEKLSDVLKSWISEGLACPRDSYQRQLRFVADCRQTINLLFDEVDVLLTPSALGEATFGLQSTGSAIFNSNWTALGLPCLNIPACRGPNNLPVGVQVVGRYHNDEKTLGFADWIYRALNVHV
jgi:Asp-tRNA(Asn)/Glu-tRNA(Gln) amidotransferase A subunit family amidase